MKLVTLSMDVMIILLSFHNIHDGVFFYIVYVLDLVIRKICACKFKKKLKPSSCLI